MLLGLSRCPLMNQQVPHVHVRVAQIGTEDGFTEKVGEFTPGRMPAEERAALVPRAVELLVGCADVAAKTAKKRRQNLFLITRRCIHKLSDEVGLFDRIVVDDAHAASDQLVGHVAASFDKNENRNAEAVSLNAVEFADFGVLY